MSAIFNAVLPIFALIFAGFLVRRIGVLGAQATVELNRFVVYLALPALLFDAIGHAHIADIWQPGFSAAFIISSLFAFALPILVPLRRPHKLADAAIDGLNAGYGNTGYMGFPLALLTFGREALPLATIAMITTACILFAIGIILIEFGLHARAFSSEVETVAVQENAPKQTASSSAKRDRARENSAHPAQIILKVGRSLIRNPLLVAPCLGAVFPISGLAMPGVLETFIKLMAGAASPCALVALGLFLAEKGETKGRAKSAVSWLVGLKLLAQPLIAWIIAGPILGLSPLLTHSAVLLAALPTGTGPFMLAEFYHREADVTARVILVSTVLSVLTLSLYLALIG